MRNLNNLRAKLLWSAMRVKVLSRLYLKFLWKEIAYTCPECQRKKTYYALRPTNLVDSERLCATCLDKACYPETTAKSR